MAAAIAAQRVDVGPSDTATEDRPLCMLTVAGHNFEQLVCEVVQRIESGAKAGTTWLKPLALRRVENATLAQAAWEYDPTIGWLDHASSDGLGAVTVFSQLIQAAVVPTAKLRDVQPGLALVVRSLYEAHAAGEIFEGEGDLGAPASDSGLLHDFMRRVHLEGT